MLEIKKNRREADFQFCGGELSETESLLYVLFSVFQYYPYAVFLVDESCYVFGAIDAAVLTSGASETNHQAGESALHIVFNGGGDYLFDVFNKLVYVTILLEEVNDLFIASG